MRLAHIRNGQLIKRFSGEHGWLTLENGDEVSPPMNGFVSGSDRVVPLVERTDDTSTGPKTVKTRSLEITDTLVTSVTTIRDKNQTELNADLDAIMARFDTDPVLRMLVEELLGLQPGNVTKPEYLQTIRARIASYS